MLASAAPRGTRDDRNLHPLAPRPPHFKTKAKSVILAIHERRAEPGRYVGTTNPKLTKSDGQELKGFDKDTGFFHRPGRPAYEIAV